MIQSSSSDGSARYYNNKILNLFSLELRMSKSKLVLKKKLKDLIDKLKKFKAQTILVLEYKKIYDHKPTLKSFYSNAKLIVNHSDIDEGFRSMRQSSMKKPPFSANTALLKYLLNMELRFLSVSRDGKTSIEK